jgi:nitrate reductase gamma subunit
MTLNTLLFGVYPYVALAICVIGAWARFDTAQYTWKAHSSQMLRTTNMRIASNLFHVGVIGILLGHFVGLLTPEPIYHIFISTAAKQVLAMVVGGIFGAMCFVGLVMLIHRRLTDPRIKANTSTSDMLVLIVLLVQLSLGMLSIAVSAQHMDGSVMVRLADWAQAIVTFRPEAAVTAITPVSVIYKLHVVLGLTLFVLFPFTRLVHIISAPVWYLGRRYQVVRTKQQVS